MASGVRQTYSSGPVHRLSKSAPGRDSQYVYSAYTYEEVNTLCTKCGARCRCGEQPFGPCGARREQEACSHSREVGRQPNVQARWRAFA